MEQTLQPPVRHHKTAQALRLVVAVLALAASGALLSPFAGALRRAELDAGLLQPAPEIDRADALSQQIALFSLGGLRSLAAEILTLDATNAWVARDWPRAERRWRSITTLAPKRVNYWASAARDMAVNAAADTANSTRLSEVESATLSERYRQSGLRFLHDGLRNNPQSVLLHCRLGDLHSDLYRRPQFAEAAKAYHRAVELGAPAVYARQEFYNLCRIRGREKEAYELGRRLFEAKENHVPSVSCLLFVLQHILQLPENERLDIDTLFGSPERARKTLRSYAQNRLRFPIAGIEEYLNESTPTETEGM